MYRRGQVCRAANHRYLEVLASVTGSNSLLQEAAEVCRPVTRNGKRYRGLNALAQKDHALLLALSRGEFALTSIRNADLRALLYPSVKTSKTSKAETRRTSAAITRQFALNASSRTAAETLQHSSLSAHGKRPTNYHRFNCRLQR
jgi:hypothetical protein